MAEQVTQIAVHDGLLSTCVTVKDFRVSVFDVDNPLVDIWHESVDVMPLDVKTCFYVEFPVTVLYFREFFDEETPYTRFTASERHASARGKKIEGVYHEFVE